MWLIKGHISESQFETRLSSAYYLLIFLLLIITGRIFIMQVLEGQKYRRASESNRIQRYVERAARGIIYDKNGNILVGNIPAYSIKFIKQGLTAVEITESVEAAGRILGINTNRLLSRILNVSKDLEITLLAENVDRKAFFGIMEEAPFLKGLKPEISTKRYYSFDEPSGPLFGYVSEIDSRELLKLSKLGYKQSDLVGQCGLEKSYDLELRGIDGNISVETEASGKQLRFLQEESNSPAAGNNLVLNIDYKLQELCDRLLAKKRGCIIVLDVRNFSVLAFVSAPGFSPNRFYTPDKEEYFKELLSDPAHPLFSRVQQSLYSPGSVFKIVDISAALSEKTFSTDKMIYCSGKYILGRDRREFKCWKKEGHKEMNMVTGLVNSCDVYFYNLGLATGARLLSRYAKLYRLDELTEIDLPGEKKGLIPDEKWKEERYHSGWYDGDTINMSIGQGYVLVTPLSIACMLSAVANRGHYYRPSIVNSIISPEGREIAKTTPVLLHEIKLSREIFDFLHENLERVVSEGTGGACFTKSIRIAGKTGTAQNPHGEDHAWFSAFAPVENPEISVTVLIEHGGHGGSAAAPLAREVFLKYFNVSEK